VTARQRSWADSTNLTIARAVAGLPALRATLVRSLTVESPLLRTLRAMLLHVAPGVPSRPALRTWAYAVTITRSFGKIRPSAPLPGADPQG
jgi:hypothetical protein